MAQLEVPIISTIIGEGGSGGALGIGVGDRVAVVVGVAVTVGVAVMVGVAVTVAVLVALQPHVYPLSTE